MSFVYFDKYKYKHVEDHNLTPRDNKENKDNNGADKKKFTPKIPNKKFTPNINNNCLVGPPRGKSLDGQAPTYSTMQIRTLKLLANVNTVNTENDDNNKVVVSNNVLTTRDNNSWMFDNNSSTSNNSQARISTFNYSSSSSSTSSSTSTSSALAYDQRTAHIWDYDIVQLHMEQDIVQCHDIAAAEEICFDFQRKTAEYSESVMILNNFLLHM